MTPPSILHSALSPSIAPLPFSSLPLFAPLHPYPDTLTVTSDTSLCFSPSHPPLAIPPCVTPSYLHHHTPSLIAVTLLPLYASPSRPHPPSLCFFLPPSLSHSLFSPSHPHHHTPCFLPHTLTLTFTVTLPVTLPVFAPSHPHPHTPSVFAPSHPHPHTPYLFSPSHPHPHTPYLCLLPHTLILTLFVFAPLHPHTRTPSLFVPSHPHP